MLNVLSVDVEDYFHVEAFAASVARDAWDGFEPRVERNTRQVTEILGRRGVRATFFVLGWTAEKFPDMVREIAAAGHEIGCHSYSHRHIRRLTPEQFRGDLRKARDILAGQAQRPVAVFRAPTFSIVKETLWALDVLAEEGFRIDSSIFPVRHDLYGMPDAPRFPHWRRCGDGRPIFEFPPSTARFLGSNIGAGGGGYLRLLPYAVTSRAIRRINQEGQPGMVYFHPWEVDPAQPRIAAPLKSRFRHYTNLSRVERKIDRLLEEFRFGTLTEVCEGLSIYQQGPPAAKMTGADG